MKINKYCHGIVMLLLSLVFFSCKSSQTSLPKEVSAATILGNPNYQAMCYGGYRTNSRENVPTVAQIVDDLRILSAMNIKVLRTYNVHYAETAHLLEAIRLLQKENPAFEMYVMLGAWIDCKNAWTGQPLLRNQDSDRNPVEIAEAVRLAQLYPDIIKIIAVGNEAMVKWASAYYVEPSVILKWVNHLQTLKQKGELPKDLWITSSDNFASWGGGDKEYHVADLTQLLQAVDYVSVHTYPMHDTHYNPKFWGVLPEEASLSEKEKIDKTMQRARDYAVNQFNNVKKYMSSLGIDKPIHIGETGWASVSNELYGADGSKATDEYKAAVYHNLMRDWSTKAGISLFYFEGFDEQWKDAKNPLGSENHFGMITLEGKAKFALWKAVDQGVFKGLTREGKTITKTYDGDEKKLWEHVKTPPVVQQ